MKAHAKQAVEEHGQVQDREKKVEKESRTCSPQQRNC